jgi:hypothetical protein
VVRMVLIPVISAPDARGAGVGRWGVAGRNSCVSAAWLGGGR